MPEKKESKNVILYPQYVLFGYEEY